MKNFKKSPLSFLTLVFLFLLTISFTTNTTTVNEILQDEQLTVTNADLPPGNNCCCPTNWFLTQLIGNDDPAEKWDKNGDGWICFKSEGIGNDTPHGNGNDPLFTQSNVKENNNPCDDGEFNPCGN